MQVLLDEEQYARLAERARAEHRSVGSLIREAIDMAWAAPDAQRQSAASAILAAEPMDVPGVEELRRELDDLRSGRFS